MGVNTQRYVRKPLYVNAVRVRESNFDEIATWCQGEITQEVRGSGAPKKCIRVRVQYPKNPRQTLAFVGDWILYTDRGYKVYTNKAFKLAFDLTEDQPVSVPPDVGADGRAEPQTRPVVEEKPATAEEIRAGLPDAQDRRPVEPVAGESDQDLTEAAEELAVDLSGVKAEEPGPEAPPVESAVEDDTTPQGEPHEYVEATPESIAGAMRENEVERARVAEEAERGRVAVEESSSSPQPLTPPEVAPEPRVTEQQPEVDTAGKQVLSEKEQERLGPDQVQTLVRSGEAVLAQDLR